MKRVILGIAVMVTLVSMTAYAGGVSGWAVNEVNEVFDSDIISSMYFDDYTRNITRQEYGYIMFQLYEHLSGEPIAYDIDLSGNYAFTDTSDLYLIALSGADLIAGYPDGSYKPDANITREEIMVLYIRLLEKLGYTFEESSQRFADEKSISEWAFSAVKKCVSTGIIKGRNGNVIDPKGNATVEESLVVLNRIMHHEMFAPATVEQFTAADSIVSNGSRTYAVTHDLLGTPIGIEEYRDFDYVGNVVSGFVGTRLCIDNDVLYYEDESGQLAAYRSLVPVAQISVAKEQWHVSEEQLYLQRGDGYDVYDVLTGELISSGVILPATDDLVFSNSVLTISETLSFDDVKDYAVAGEHILMVETDGQLVGYDRKREQTVQFGFVDCESIEATGNYFVTRQEMHNGTIFVRYMPLFDIRRFIGSR